MDNASHKEVMAHAEVQFAPQRDALGNQHNQELRQAQYRARTTNNTAAMLPAEARCYVAHARALVVAWAKAIADAYTSFNKPTGPEADRELSSFCAIVLASRKASFAGEVELRQIRTRDRNNNGQLAGLLRTFDRSANPALLEGRAILNKQRVVWINKQQAAVANIIKYVVDTCVFNWLADGLIQKEDLPCDGGFAITHIQVDEINNTKDGDRRARLSLMQISLRCELIATQTFLFDVSRLDYAKLGDGKIFIALRDELNLLNGNKKSNIRDALIAEATIVNRYTLLTADADLKAVTENHGGTVILLLPKARPSTVEP
jgi:hypothetical protein